MSQRNYSNTAQPTSLSSGVSDSDTTLTVPSTSGYPTAPFTIALDRGNANEEIVLVQGKTGTTFTNCVRGWDGTTAQTHLASVSVEHVVVAADAEDANHHVYDTGRDDHLQYLTSARHAALNHDAIISSATLPVGSSVDWWGANDPAGGKWLICDGRAVSRTTYADLFSELGTTHGSGDGSTTFNIPDSRGRFTLHIDSGTGRVTDANAANIGGTGGAELVTLTAAQIPTHLHSVSITSSTAGNHSHENVTGTTASGGSHDHYLAGNTTGNAGGQLQYVASADTPGNPVGDTLFGLHKSNTAGRGKTYDGGAHTHTFSGSTGTTGNHTHAITGNTGSVGGGGSHQNMPPWIACNKIIRALP